MTASCTLVTSEIPSCLTKEYGLKAGELVKSTSANLVKGRADIVSIPNIRAFADLLTALHKNQCLIHGVPPKAVELVSERMWQELGCPEDPIPRTAKMFSWPAGPAILMLDRDAPKDGSRSLGKKALFQILLNACPALECADFVWYPSASSFIYAGDQELTGLRGQRIYILVLDGRDIERAGRVLNERLWAMGFGHFEVSQSGVLLERGVFDTSVWQTNHLDFAAGANCRDGLEQRRGEPVVFGCEQPRYLDTRGAIPDLTAEELKLAQENKNRCRADLANAADLKRREWMTARGKEIRERKPQLPKDQINSIVQRAIENRDLSADWILTIQEHNGTLVNISVSDVLNNSDRYDGLLTLDPLEPDYDGSRLVGKLFLKGARQNLFSFAHGGTNFRLHRQPAKVILTDGRSSQAIDDFLKILKNIPDVYDFGSDLVRVDGSGRLYALNDSSLRYFAGLYAQFVKLKSSANGATVETLLDPPDRICRSIISLDAQRQLKPLNGVITAPTLRADGSVLQVSGYDKATQLLCDFRSDTVFVAAQPSKTQALAALETLIHPFQYFPFCSPLDRAVLLATLLTAAVRPALGVAPGFGFDAPSQGSGKTLIARSVGVLMQGSEPSVWPHTAGRDDEETRKRVFTVLRSGARCLIWDNVTGSFDSPALAACLTSPTFTDRILGQSNSSTVPNRLLFLLTGNNLLLQGEMTRRVLVCRIDPATERPFAREFSLDPFAYCRDNRQELIAAALTLIRAYLTHGCKTQISGRLASFEDWDNWIRRTVIFADELMPGMFGDVMNCITANQAVDPDLELFVNLLRAWHAVYRESHVSVSDLIRSSYPMSTEKHLLQNALTELPIGGGNANVLNAKSVGRYLGYRKDRIAGGYRLEAGPKIDDRNTWRVRRIGTGI